MKYRKYESSIRESVVRSKIANPKLSYEDLCLMYNVTCPETIRYWMDCYKKIGVMSFVDKRHKV